MLENSTWNSWHNSFCWCFTVWDAMLENCDWPWYIEIFWRFKWFLRTWRSNTCLWHNPGIWWLYLSSIRVSASEGAYDTPYSSPYFATPPKSFSVFRASGRACQCHRKWLRWCWRVTCSWNSFLSWEEWELFFHRGWRWWQVFPDRWVDSSVGWLPYHGGDYFWLINSLLLLTVRVSVHTYPQIRSALPHPCYIVAHLIFWEVCSLCLCPPSVGCGQVCMVAEAFLLFSYPKLMNVLTASFAVLSYCEKYSGKFFFWW